MADERENRKPEEPESPPEVAARPRPVKGPRRNPARMTRVATVGASSTAVLALMASYHLSEAATAAETVPADSLEPPAPEPGSLRLRADAEVVVLTVDAEGRVVDLSQMESVAELQAFLSQAEPILNSATDAPASTPTPTTAPAPTTALAPAPASTPTPTLAPAPAPTTALAPAPAPAPVPAPTTTLAPAVPAPVDLVVPTAPAGNSGGS